MSSELTLSRSPLWHVRANWHRMCNCRHQDHFGDRVVRTMFPQLAKYTDLSLLLLRLLFSVVFVRSGINDLKDTQTKPERSVSVFPKTSRDSWELLKSLARGPRIRRFHSECGCGIGLDHVWGDPSEAVRLAYRFLG